MKSRENPKLDFEKRLKKVLQTPASFAFFVAIHDFIKYIELTPVLSRRLLPKTKVNQDAKLASKYASLRQIYQGLEDAGTETNEDLGHDRYMTVCDLNRIQKEGASESNTFWKKRETFRRLTAEIYEHLNINLPELSK